MNKILRIALREYLETIKTKTFIISLIMTPLLIAAIGWINSRLEKNITSAPKPPRRIAVIDMSQQVSGELSQGFQRYNTVFPQRPLQMLTDSARRGESPDQRLARLTGDVREGRLDGLMVVAPDVTASTGGGHNSKYYAKSKNIGDLDTVATVRRLLNEAVLERRYKQHNLSAQLIAQLNRPVPLEQVELGMKEGGRGRAQMAMIMVPFFFMFLMFMGIVGTCQGMLTSVIEEKNSRVIEVLLSAVSPQALMAGKILGLVGVGLTLIGIWGAASFGAAAHYHLLDLVRPGLLAYFVVFYILGFLAIASIYAAIGSACNTLKEAQNLLGPVTMLIVLPMVAWMPIAQNPNGTLAIILSFIPTTAPLVMVLRLSADPALPLTQVAAAIVVLLASALAIVWAAGKVFRTGILMYGKPPTLRELLRWVRRS